MKIKKIILILCLSIIVIMFIPKEEIAVYAGEEEITCGDFKYREFFDEETKEGTGYVTLTEYIGNEENVIIPGTLDGKIVLETSPYVFYSNSTVKSVTLPNTLKLMFVYTFYKCSNLEIVNIPDTIEIIHEYFVFECPKAKYTIPAKLEKLGKNLNISYVDVSDVTINGTYCYDLANEVIRLVNEERVKDGLQPYTIDEEIMQFATIRSSEIAIALTHERPSGLSTQSLIENQRVPCTEVIGGGHISPEQIVKAWLDSQFHHPTLMSYDAKACGAGCYMTDDGHLYWIFAASSKTPEELTTQYSGREENVETTIKISKYHNFANLWIEGLDTNNVLTIGESISPTDVGNINIGWDWYPTRIKKSDITWKSSDKNVFVVDNSGTVTAVGKGTAILTATLGNSVLNYTINVVSEKIMLGDVNGDRNVTLADYTKILAHVKKTQLLTGDALKAADVNGDGNVTLADYTKVLAHVKKTALLY